MRRLRARLLVRGLEVRLVPAFTEFLDPHPAAGNLFGAEIVALSTGNVVVTSPGDDAGETDAGAVYLFNGKTGALISTLTGSHANDSIGTVLGASAITALSNGNFIVSSMFWDGVVADVGAVTWCSGTTGISGVVSASNSLVGTTINDFVGYGGVTALSNGNYVVASPGWQNAMANGVGAVTWCSGMTGLSGSVSSANSLVGSSAGDLVGYDGVTALSNGNYVVKSTYWNGAATSVGAVTWGSGNTGVVGVVSAANSLVGSKADDRVGYSGVTVLSNGNYVVGSRYWDNTAVDVGAVTWGNGATGISGNVGPANSLIGSKNNDFVGYYEAIALSNGSFVVPSPYWDGAAADVGAVTWGNGATGIVGVVSAANSLVGSKTDDNVGYYGVTALSNGNYVVASPLWDGAAVNVGAVTWGNGAVGITGAVSSANSLVGSKFDDTVGYYGVTALSNGNYVVISSDWDGAATNVGAVTWCNGAIGNAGAVSAVNSLVGSTVSDRVGFSGVTALTNGNYVVCSGLWDGVAADVGAATWSYGTNGIIGVVSAANSLVGSKSGDEVGDFGATALSNGNYVVSSPYWNNGPALVVGAATWANGNNGVSGVVSAANSLIGSTASDEVGFDAVTALANGNYVLATTGWDNGMVVDAGAVTWGNGVTGVSGVISKANSILGSVSSSLQSKIVVDNVNGTFIGSFPSEGSGRVRVGSQTTGLSPPKASVVTNNGAMQRSRVTSVTVAFDQVVTLPGAPETAFQLKRQGDNALPALTANVNNSGLGTMVTLTFAGTTAVNFGSLADGRYTLSINASKVSTAYGQLDGNGDGIAGDDYVLASAATPNPATNIFRLFGDSDGDGTVAANDFIQFRLALGGNSPVFDFDGDGAVAASDFIQFRLRFGGSI